MKISPINNNNVHFSKIVRLKLTPLNKPKEMSEEDEYSFSKAIDKAYFDKETIEYNNIKRQKFLIFLKETFGNYLAVQTKENNYILTDKDAKKAQQIKESGEKKIIDFKSALEKIYVTAPPDEDTPANRHIHNFFEICNAREKAELEEKKRLQVIRETISDNTSMMQELLVKKNPETIELKINDEGKITGFNYFCQKGTVIKSETFDE